MMKLEVGRRPPAKRGLVPLLLACALLGQSLAAGVIAEVEASARYRKRTVTARPGLTLTRLLDRRGPNRIRILEVDPSTELTIDVALAHNELPAQERTSAMARRRGAVAAINGDYTALGAGEGRPVNAFARNGSLKASPLIWGRNFAVSQDEGRFYFDHAPLKASLAQRDSDERWSIPAWNEHRPPRDTLSLSTPAGGVAFRPPTHACSARLYPKGRMSWEQGQVGVRRAHVVDRVRCAETRVPRFGGVVVSAGRGTAAGGLIRSALTRGEVVDLRWSMGAWAGVLDTIGGNPLLVADGSIATEACSDSYFCYRNPRTGIGIDSAGNLLLVTVDGRRPGYSVGMTPAAFARLFRYLGAEWALNLDGGGSTTMWLQGEVVNRPSDPAGERSVGSSILVLPARERSEPTLLEPSFDGSGVLARAVAPAGSEGSQESPLRLAALDPASTGGMLDALAKGAFGPRRATLPPSLVVMLDRFEDYYGAASGHPMRPLPLPARLDPAASRAPSSGGP